MKNKKYQILMFSCTGLGIIGALLNAYWHNYTIALVQLGLAFITWQMAYIWRGL